jgi:flagellar protein FlaG
MINIDALNPITKEQPIKKIAQGRKKEIDLKEEEAVKDIEEMVELLNKTSHVYDRGLSFKLHKETDRIMLRVIDKDTKEIIREVPSEEILDLIAELYQLSGIVIDKKS